MKIQYNNYQMAIYCFIQFLCPFIPFGCIMSEIETICSIKCLVHVFLPTSSFISFALGACRTVQCNLLCTLTRPFSPLKLREMSYFRLRRRASRGASLCNTLVGSRHMRNRRSEKHGKSGTRRQQRSRRCRTGRLR